MQAVPPMDRASLAVELGKAWLNAYRDAPEDPLSSDQFDHVQALLDQSLERGVMIDPVVRQAYQWISTQDPPEAAVEFMLSVMHQFENVTELGVDDPRVSALVCVPIIGMREHAQHIARNADNFDFEEDLVSVGAIPRGAKMKWLPRPVSLSEAGEWMADHRRALLMAGMEGKPLDAACPPPQEPYGIDRAELSLLVGVMVAHEKEVDQCMKDPVFLYSNPTDFFDENAVQEPGDDWALLRREEALEQASDVMTQKLVRSGISHTVMENPGTMTEALARVAAWSLRLQLLGEAAVMGVSEEDLDRGLATAVADVAMDTNAGVVSLVLTSGGRLYGPFATDLPWRSVPLPMLADALLARQLAPNPENIRWHENQEQMWQQVQSGQRKWRLN